MDISIIEKYLKKAKIKAVEEFDFEERTIKYSSKITQYREIKKVSGNADVFEFTITTPTLRSQFLLPRAMVNKLRILIEKALMGKGAKGDA